MKQRHLAGMAFLSVVCAVAHAADPVDIYIVRYLAKSEQKSTIASGGDIAMAQDIGRQAGGLGSEQQLVLRSQLGH